ncbi:unnamed protein product [Mucor hiemalis]
MKSLTAKANTVSQTLSTNTDNLASTEGTIGNSDTTNSSVTDVSETVSNVDITVIQETTNDVDSSSDVGDGSWVFGDRNITRFLNINQLSILWSANTKHFYWNHMLMTQTLVCPF